MNGRTVVSGLICRNCFCASARTAAQPGDSKMKKWRWILVLTNAEEMGPRCINLCLSRGITPVFDYYCVSFLILDMPGGVIMAVAGPAESGVDSAGG